jgi:uncharacterized membrane protein
MLEFLRSTTAQAVIWGTSLILLCMIGAYVVKWFREAGDRGEASASDLLSEFRQMREGGEITTEEFRHIKGVLGTKLQQSLRAKDAEGDE